MRRQMKLRNLISLSSIVLIFLLNGCGGGGSKSYRETAPAKENDLTKEDESLIVTNENGDANITYVELNDGSIYIDCSGGCGDIYIGKEVLEDTEPEEEYGPKRD